MKQLKLILVVILLVTAASCAGKRPAENDQFQETIRGVVLEVNGDLTSIESFVVRTDDGEVLEVRPAPDGDFRFPLPHLRDHLRTSEPILVELDRTVNPPWATAIRDADNPAWHGAAPSTLASTDDLRLHGGMETS